MPRYLSFPLFLACLLLPAAAQALSILKCVSPEGKIVMSDPPCPPGYSSEVQRVRPNVLQSDGLRKWADRNADGRPSGQGRAGSGYGAAPSPAPVAAQRPADSIECENARRAYAFEAGYRYRTPSSLEMKRRDVEISCTGR